MSEIIRTDDVVIDMFTQRYICQYLNKTYTLVEDCVDYNLTVPLDKRDRLYYACITVVQANIQEYKKLIMALYKCKLITYSKHEYILDKLELMKQAINDNVEVLKHEA